MNPRWDFERPASARVRRKLPRDPTKLTEKLYQLTRARVDNYHSLYPTADIKQLIIRVFQQTLTPYLILIRDTTLKRALAKKLYTRLINHYSYLIPKKDRKPPRTLVEI
jgi:hypothetical protein